MDARHKPQRKFIAAKKAAGLERLILWVRPEEKERAQADLTATARDGAISCPD